MGVAFAALASGGIESCPARADRDEWQGRAGLKVILNANGAAVEKVMKLAGGWSDDTAIEAAAAPASFEDIIAPGPGGL